MVKPRIVHMTPIRENMMYSVQNKEGIEELVEKIAPLLIALGSNIAKVIIFCTHYDQCSIMYRMFKHKLGPYFTVPPSAPDLSKYRVVDMYTRCTETTVKEQIITSFSKIDGNLRVVIGTCFWYGTGLS